MKDKILPWLTRNFIMHAVVETLFFLRLFFFFLLAVNRTCTRCTTAHVRVIGRARGRGGDNSPSYSGSLNAIEFQRNFKMLIKIRINNFSNIRSIIYIIIIIIIIVNCLMILIIRIIHCMIIIIIETIIPIT